MAGSARYTAVLDACVLYPAPVRDLLLSLAHRELYHARWSNEIQEEWIRNVLLDRPDLSAEQLRRTTSLMQAAIPDAVIKGYEPHIEAIKLPDPDDRHVVAAALVGHADAIVTFNLKDFPAETLAPLSLEAQHPDDFVINQLHLNLTESLKAIKLMRQRLRAPPMSMGELATVWTRCGLPQTALFLADYADLI